MKVIGIVGSPRKNGNTELLTRHTLKAISQEGLDTAIDLAAGLAAATTPRVGCCEPAKCLLESLLGVSLGDLVNLMQIRLSRLDGQDIILPGL